MSIGTKVKIERGAYKLVDGELESLAQFWGIPEDAVGEITGFAKPPFEPHPIVHWDKATKPSFQDLSWHPSNLVPA